MKEILGALGFSHSHHSVLFTHIEFLFLFWAIVVAVVAVAVAVAVVAVAVVFVALSFDVCIVIGKMFP